MKKARFDHKETLRDFGFVKHETPILKVSYEDVYLIARENFRTSIEKADQTCCTENVASGFRRRSSEET